MSILANVFDMGKYHECAAMLNVVVTKKDVEGTFQVAKQLLENVDTMGDFRETKLYQHMKFRDAENSYAKAMKKALLEGFRTEEEFSYMNGYEPWDQFIHE